MAWLLKIDADLLFLNSRVFRQIADCQEDLFGQPYSHPSGLTYSQGGCYAIKTEFLTGCWRRPWPRRCVSSVHRLGCRSRICPRTLASFAGVAQCARVKFSDFYLPAERIPTFVPSAAEPASAIHFETGGGKHLRLHMPRIANSAAVLNEFRRAA